MKKICRFLLFFIFLVVCFSGFNFKNVCHAKSQTNSYAKALNNCVLYKSQNVSDEIDNIYFIVPETYFVMILEDLDETLYKVQYDTYIGYVKKEFVLIVSFIPNVKYLNDIKCDIKQTSGTQVWNKPSAQGNVLTTIPAGTLEIDYISYVYGEIPIGGESNLWFYVSYTPSTNSTNVYHGYIYSENVTNLTEIPINLEENPEREMKADSVAEDNVKISSTFKTIIVSLISIPIILLISIILYKIAKFITKNTLKRNNQNISDVENFSNYKHGGFYSVRSDNYSNLKNEINEMKNKTYVKKISGRNLKDNYPSFPDYDSEDDLL